MSTATNVLLYFDSDMTILREDLVRGGSSKEIVEELTGNFNCTLGSELWEMVEINNMLAGILHMRTLKKYDQLFYYDPTGDDLKNRIVDSFISLLRPGKSCFTVRKMYT